MKIAPLLARALAKPDAYLDYPFDEESACVRVAGRIFILFLYDRERNFYMNFKCSPELGALLRQKYSDAVIPGYHMNKQHWCSLVMAKEIPLSDAYSMIDHAYDQAVAKLPAKIRKNLSAE